MLKLYGSARSRASVVQWYLEELEVPYEQSAFRRDRLARKQFSEKHSSMDNEPTSNKSQTDGKHLDAMTDEDIDLSDCPEITPELFAKAVVRRGLPSAKNKAFLKYEPPS